jgi:hypothetical protein
MGLFYKNSLISSILVLDGAVFFLLVFLNIIFLFYVFFNKNEEKFLRLKLILFSKADTRIEKIKKFHLYFFFLVPNLLIVNHKFPTIVKLCLGILLMFLGSLFSFFYFLFFVQSIFGIFSFIFGYFYDKNLWFRKKIKVFYFKNNTEEEVNFLFYYFFGNTFRGGAYTSVGTLGGSLYHFKKQDELHCSYAFAKTRVDANPFPPKGFEEYRNAVREEQTYILQNETIIHAFEHKASQILQNLF